MEKVTFNLPSMWADHHVLAVREALEKAPGVQQVIASAMYQDVVIEYDPAAANPDDLGNVLSEKGYQVAKAPVLPTHPERIDDSSDWFQFQERITETDLRDLKMSGDHRMY